MTVSETLSAALAALRAEFHPYSGIYERRVFGETARSIFVAMSYPDDLAHLFFDVTKKSVRQRLDLETKAIKLSLDGNGEGGGQVRIRLELVHKPFADLFEELCVDVVTAFLSHEVEADAVDALRSRVGHWQRFMELAGGRGLSPDHQIGLYGELSHFRRLLEAGMHAHDALRAWQGPLGGNQDFMFGNTALEVKSTASNRSTQIMISNERQLDDSGLKRLYLCHYAFDRRPKLPATLPALIEEIGRLVGEELAPALDDLLLSAGYHRSHEDLYRGVGYVERRTVFYIVENEFPRIVPSDLLPGVQEVQYCLELSAATRFVVDGNGVFLEIISEGKS